MDRAIAEYISCDYLFPFQCFSVTHSWNISELASLSSAVGAVVSPLQAFCYVNACHYMYSQMPYFFWHHISHTNTKSRSLGYILRKWFSWNNWILEETKAS